MTDNEIIKALECCNGKRKHCDDCPCIKNGKCIEVEGMALNLINRQRAEIEKLTKKLEQLLCFATNDKITKCSLPINEMINAAEDYEEELCDKARAEAIREFAEKLKETLINTPFGVNCSGETDEYKNGCLRGLVEKQNNVLDVINTLVKEMVGEDND